MSLLVPKHYLQKGKPVSRVDNPINSDDFVSPGDIRAQLQQLKTFVAARRELHPNYQLPRPVGWRVQVLVLDTPGETAGGLLLPEDEGRAVSSPQGVIVAMGGAAYTDKRRFSIGAEIVPWVSVGDRIQFVKYDAHLFTLGNGQVLGTLTDTQPVAVIDSGWEIEL